MQCMFNNLSLVLVAILTTSCLKARVTQNIKQADLTSNFNIGVIGNGFASCDAAFFTGAFTQVQLEGDAVVACDGQLMSYSSQTNDYSTIIQITHGQPNTITVIRPQSGASMVSNVYTF
jgi:hypothetical protein